MDEYNTLCYCPSCVLERKDIEYQLKQFPPSVTQTSIANYLNLRYEQMREKCINKKAKNDETDSGCYKDFSLGSVLKFAMFLTSMVAFVILILLIGNSL